MGAQRLAPSSAGNQQAGQEFYDYDPRSGEAWFASGGANPSTGVGNAACTGRGKGKGSKAGGKGKDKYNKDSGRSQAKGGAKNPLAPPPSHEELWSRTFT